MRSRGEGLGYSGLESFLWYPPRVHHRRFLSGSGRPEKEGTDRRDWHPAVRSSVPQPALGEARQPGCHHWAADKNAAPLREYLILHSWRLLSLSLSHSLAVLEIRKRNLTTVRMHFFWLLILVSGNIGVRGIKVLWFCLMFLSCSGSSYSVFELTAISCLSLLRAEIPGATTPGSFFL